ncbi:MAG TPA: anti-sigma factor [Candidatus Acidoferrales bacterium]
MACENNKLLLRAYFDGELDAVRSVEFEEHLKTCTQCSQELREQQAMRDSLRAANLYERAPEGLRARIRASLPAEARPQPIPIPRRPVLEWLAVAATILIAVFLGARVLPNIGGQRENLVAEEIVASHIRSMQPGHLYDVESTDQHTVKPWFDGKLDFAPPVIDLKEQGFPLVGGRLDYVDHRNVAALVYQRRKHFINVFVWPEESKTAKLPDVQTIQGYNLVSWSHDGMHFCAASDLNIAEVRQFAGLLEQ